jgi:hypothetical protein
LVSDSGRQAGDLTDEVNHVLARYGITPEAFREAKLALALFDGSHDDAEFFLLGLIPALFPEPVELKPLQHDVEPRPDL